MIYKYDPLSMVYKRITHKVFLLTFAFGIICYGLAMLTTFVFNNKIEYMSQETKAIIIRENDKANEFTPERLKAYILELNIKFPHIVYAQAVQETGSFKSNIFKENANIFGMKKAYQRPTTNKGEENGHAYYSNWKESVQDYAMYSAAYLNNIRSESEYYQYLAASYAEDPNYVKRLKAIISKNNILKK